VTALVLAVVAACGVGAALILWPARDPEVVEHSHPELPPDHPHLARGGQGSGNQHAHPYVIDDLHYLWPHGR
jgi:hypothetical protein